MKKHIWIEDKWDIIKIKEERITKIKRLNPFPVMKKQKQQQQQQERQVRP